jgi:imidazolonepropionase-like amidohydrolase
LLSQVPAAMRGPMLQEFVRTPKSVDEARQMVAALAASKVDSIKIVLESGFPGRPLQRIRHDIAVAVAEEARRRQLPVLVHTSNATDVREALTLQPASIEHGSFMDELPADVIAQMKQQGITYVPTLAVVEAFGMVNTRNPARLDLALVKQSQPQAMLDSTRAWLLQQPAKAEGQALARAMSNTQRVFAAGVPLATGTDAGNPLVFHGPSLAREVQLLVQAGVPTLNALEAATAEAARLLGEGKRLGKIAPGYEASLLMVDGDPTLNPADLERVYLVLFKGGRVSLDKLMKQDF